MKNWLFYIFSQASPGGDAAEWTKTQTTFDRYLNLCERADGLGFDGVFFSEHHFNSLNLTPSPNLMIAAAAQRTSNLRLGVMSNVVPLHDARRLVEELGMLDYLTQGRLEIGLGPGAGSGEFVQAGLNPELARPRYASGSEIVRQYVERGRVTHCDDFYQLDDVPIVPALRQQNPRVWITAMSESSAAWAAEQGYHVCTSWLSTERAALLCAAYREAATEAGRDADGTNFAVRRRVFVAPTDAEAQEIAESAIDQVLAAMEVSGTAFEAADPAIAQMFFDPDDIVIGSPKTVTERLIEQARAIGFDHLLYFPDFKLFSAQHLERSHDLIGTEIVPVLRQFSAMKVPASTS